MNPLHPSVSIAAWVIAGLLAAIVLALAIRQRERDTTAWQLFLQIGITGCLQLALAWKDDSAISLLVPAGFLITSVPLALHDLRTGRLPNWLVGLSYVLTAIAVVTAALWGREPERLVQTLVGSGLFLLFYAALYVFAPGQLGGGDVKLAGVVGSVLGWQSWPALLGGLLLIWFAGTVTYLIASATGRKQPANGHPHGPSLVIGTFIAIIAGL